MCWPPSCDPVTGPVKEPERWVLINASPEAVFAYLADLPRHGEWDAHTGFRVVRTSDGPAVEGSFCERERFEIFQAPTLRSGGLSTQVSWVKSLTVTGCEPNRSIDFETKDLYNGLSIGSESISFRLFPEGAGTVLMMANKRSAHMPGPFYVVMVVMEFVQGLASRLFIGWLFRVFPRLRTNSQLSRIKKAMEQP